MNHAVIPKYRYHKLFGGEFKYKDLLFLKEMTMVVILVLASPQLEIDFLEPLTKARTAFFTIELFRGPCMHAPLKQD